jgi:hypothetical protein
LFVRLIDTMPVSDFPVACTSGLRPLAFPNRTDCGMQPVASGISRFPYRKLLCTCPGSPTPRVQCAARAGAAHRAAFPITELGRQPKYDSFRSSIARPAHPLSTLHRPPHEGPMHDSESRLVAILYRVKDLHLLLPAGFYRRFLCVCLRVSAANFSYCISPITNFFSQRSFGPTKKNGQTRVTGFAHNHGIVT